MGQSLSVLRDDDYQQLEETVDEVIRTFSKEYEARLKDQCLIVLDHKQPQRTSKLPVCPPLNFPLRSGFLWKRGDVNRTWRHRWFVAQHEVSNFEIAYYESPAATKSNGSISCTAYRVVPFTQEEAENEGQFGFKLVPSFSLSHSIASEERLWYLRAKSEEDLTLWLEVFHHATRNSHNTNQAQLVMTRAFEEAIVATRMQFGLFDYYEITGDEVHELTTLTMSVLEAGMMKTVMQRLGLSRKRTAQVKYLYTMCFETVINTVTTAWTTLSLSARDSQEATFQVVSTSHSAISAARSHLKMKIVSGYFDRIDSKTQRLMEAVGSPLVKVVLPQVVQAWREIFSLFVTQLYDRLASTKSGFTLLSDAIAQMHRLTDTFILDPQHRSSIDVLHHLFFSSLPLMPSSDLPASVKLNPVALRRTFWSMFDGIRTLKHDVLAGVEQRYPRGPIDGWDQVYTELVTDLMEEATRIMQEEMAILILNLLAGKTSKHITHDIVLDARVSMATEVDQTHAPFLDAGSVAHGAITEMVAREVAAVIANETGLLGSLSNSVFECLAAHHVQACEREATTPHDEQEAQTEL